MPDRLLHLAQEENIVLGAGVVNRLIEGRSGDAALLYLCLARSGASGPERLRAELGWSETQFRAAADALRAMGLIRLPEAAAAPASAPAPETAMPDYSREDVMNKLESDASFAAVLAEVERKLGRLSEPSVRKLLGLYDYLGLPADVLMLLVNHCVERKEAQFGAGRVPTMREVEKEGYAWARRELFSAAAADAYLRAERDAQSRFRDYMEALRLGARSPAPSEERYLRQWADWGFPPETVALAYDKTVLKCGEFRWPYCNGILKRWHEAGLHTPEEAAAENKPRRAAQKAAPGSGRDKNAWMDEYIE